MNTVVPLPVKPRPQHHRPLVCHGVYGRPGNLGQARTLAAAAGSVVSYHIINTAPLRCCLPGRLRGSFYARRRGKTRSGEVWRLPRLAGIIR